MVSLPATRKLLEATLRMATAVFLACRSTSQSSSVLEGSPARWRESGPTGITRCPEGPAAPGREPGRLIRKRDYEGLQAVFERSGNRMRVVPIHPALHRDARDRRGRVRKETGIATLDREEVRAYLKRQRNHVGRAKGGWAAAFMTVGGKPSKWIARWATVGRVEDRLTDPVASFIRAENRSEWARQGDDDRIVAVRSRAAQQTS